MEARQAKAKEYFTAVLNHEAAYAPATKPLDTRNTNTFKGSEDILTHQTKFAPAPLPKESRNTNTFKSGAFSQSQNAPMQARPTTILTQENKFAIDAKPVNSRNNNTFKSEALNQTPKVQTSKHDIIFKENPLK